MNYLKQPLKYYTLTTEGKIQQLYADIIGMYPLRYEELKKNSTVIYELQKLDIFKNYVKSQKLNIDKEEALRYIEKRKQALKNHYRRPYSHKLYNYSTENINVPLINMSSVKC